MKFPTSESLTPSTPLRLEVAAALGFPGGSMTASSLRRLIVAQKLEHEKIAGKYFVTLAAIEEMRTLCRVRAKVPELNSKKPATGDDEPLSSETASGPSALDAMNAIAEGLKENLQPTSSKSTTPKKQSTKVIRMGSR
jgi:hypothetical protein